MSARLWQEEASGFVLVGVVMFVLALTILGVSLFSLSSYEAQFFGRSSDETTAFYAALGGIERAKFVLARKRHYEDVTLGLPLGDIVNATATRTDNGQSTGVVDFTGTVPVDIRVTANHNGASRTVQQRFIPVKPNHIYRRLITAYDGVKVIQTETIGPQVDRSPQTYMDGAVWQHNPDILWNSLAQVDPSPFSRTVTVADVPHPDVVSYISVHQTFVTPAVNQGNYDLTSGNVFYETSGTLTGTLNGYGDGYGAYSSGTSTITVSGTAIWLLDHGFKSDKSVQVNAGPVNPSQPMPLLIIVARDPVGRPPEESAINFLGGLNSTVPVIIVSDGTVDIEHLNDFSGVSTLASYISIFANYVVFGGPTPGWSARIIHPSTLSTIDWVIDDLYDAGLLPNSTAGISTQFVTVPRTWREVTY